MKTQKGEDFLVEANGHCFFCLAKVIPQFPGVKSEPSTTQPSCSPESMKSLQCLSRYLKVDIRKVFHEKDYVPPHLLAKVEQARLKVELCRDCSYLTESFSKLYRTLEKVEMGMANFANQIRKKLEVADETGKAEQLVTAAPSDLNLGSGMKGKLQIVKMLRKEVVQKCIDKLGPVQPTVKLRRLTIKQVQSERSKINSESKKTFKKIDQVGGTSQRLLSEPRRITVHRTKVEVAHSDSEDPFQEDVNDYAASEYMDGSDIPSQNEQESTHSEDAQATTITASSVTTGPELVDVGKFQCTFDAETDKYTCKLCGKGLGSKTACKRHYDNIHVSIKYKCNLCGKELSQLSAYRRHLRTVHMGVRFECQVCNKKFTQKCYLTDHLKLSASCRSGQHGKGS